MDPTVLQRQRTKLGRLSRQSTHEKPGHFDVHSVFDRQILRQQAANHDNGRIHGERNLASEKDQGGGGGYSTVSNGNCSFAGKITAARPSRQCNSSLSSNNRKRKSEFDIEEEGQGQAEETVEEKSEITMKAEREASTNTCCRESSKISEVQKPDYIHVRARRGQATDSHSLAERARREKISKKMKCLQDLVPGCNTVTGKAGMLDEIINYVQSLQKQVEFLSMKLAAVNTRFDFSTDNFFVKESPASVCCLTSPAAAITQFEPTNSSCFPYNLMQHGSSNSMSDIAVDHSQALQKSGPSFLPNPEAFLESSSYMPQMLSWELDWQWQSLPHTGSH